MPFISVGSGDDLILSIPTDRTTNWGSDFKNNFAQKIAEHNHTGSGTGQKLSSSSIATDGIKGVNILLDNDEYLRGRNNADSANINLIKVDVNDDAYIDPDLAKLNLKNAIYLTARNQADSANVNILRLTTSDKVELPTEISAVVKLSNNIALQHRNQADAAYISTINLNTSDKITLGADLANASMIGNTYFTGRNNADSAYINIVKINTSDEIEFGTNTIHNGSLTLNDYLTQVDVTFALADNQSSAANITGALVTETEGFSFKFEYAVYVDATTDLLEKGTAEFTYVNGSWQQVRKYRRDDSQTVFSVASGQLKYTTPAYSGFSTAVLTYQIIEL